MLSISNDIYTPRYLSLAHASFTVTVIGNRRYHPNSKTTPQCLPFPLATNADSR